MEPVAAAGRTKRTTNMTLWLIILATLALSLMAAARVRSVYNRYNQGSVLSGLTGGEAAARILRRAGIHDVEITHHDEMLGDHYDPLHKRLVLSTQNYHGTSCAALGVSAHECGHAIQHQIAYAPLKWPRGFWNARASPTWRSPSTTSCWAITTIR